MGQPLRRLPPAETLSYLLLTMTAISGEFPVSQVRRLPGGAAYMLSVVTALKRDGLLKTYSRDSLRGLRLSKQAKRLLLADRPEWFQGMIFRGAQWSGEFFQYKGFPAVRQSENYPSYKDLR